MHVFVSPAEQGQLQLIYNEDDQYGEEQWTIVRETEVLRRHSPRNERTRTHPEVHHKVHAEHVFVIIGVPANVNSEFR